MACPSDLLFYDDAPSLIHVGRGVSAKIAIDGTDLGRVRNSEALLEGHNGENNSWRTRPEDVFT